MSPVEKQYYAMTAYKAIQAMKKRNMDAWFCDTIEDAKEKVLDIIPDGACVAWGGSMTLNDSGIKDAVRSGNYEIIDRDLAQSREEADHAALNSDYYLMSSNAITLDGKLVNIDGNGNRLAALIYGPKNVIIVAGTNKLVGGEEEALQRVRSVAAPMNNIRLQGNTPCTKSGICHRCRVDDCICCQTVITRMSSIKGRIKVLLIGEILGY